jgi:calcineurin-like phosphoesterase family protein
MHIGHSNIINFCQRPFKNVEEMNEALINNWNERVDENDVVFILGDFCFGGSQLWNETLDRLKGKKYLIIGNHDLKNLKQGYLQKFEKISYMMNIHVDDQLIYLSHFPLLCFAGSYRDKKPVWALFGHVHSNSKLKNGIDSRRLAVLFPSQYDVGVDNNDYKPISFSEVKEIITKQKNSLKWQIRGKIMDFIMKIIYKYF